MQLHYALKGISNMGNQTDSRGRKTKSLSICNTNFLVSSQMFAELLFLRLSAIVGSA